MGGLSTRTALRTLASELRALARRARAEEYDGRPEFKEESHRNRKLSSRVYAVSAAIASVCIVFLVVVLIAELPAIATSTSAWRIIAEIVLIVLALGITFGSRRMEKKQKRNEISARLEILAAEVDKCDTIQNDLLVLLEKCGPRRASLEVALPLPRVYRDGQWTNLPLQVLAKGDVLASSLELSPLAGRYLHLEEDMKTIAGEECYVLAEAPLVRIVQECLDLCTRPLPASFSQGLHVSKLWMGVSLIAFIITLLVDAVRLGVSSSLQWQNASSEANATTIDYFIAAEYLALRSVYTLFLCIPAFFVPTKMMLKILASARLLASLISCYRALVLGNPAWAGSIKRASRTDVTKPGTARAENIIPEDLEEGRSMEDLLIDVDDEYAAEMKPVKEIPGNEANISTGSILRLAYHIVKDHGRVLSKTGPLLHSLGNATVIAFIDSTGVLRDAGSSVHHILLPKHSENIVLDMSPARPAQRSGDSYAIASNRATFDDRNWNSYLSELKPLGLNCLLSSIPGLSQLKGRGTLPNYRRQTPGELDMFRDLAMEIGFEEKVRSSYRLISQATILVSDELLPSPSPSTTRAADGDKRRHSGPGISLPRQHGRIQTTVVEDVESKTLQLMSRGSLELVLRECSDYWDGESLQVLTPEVRERIQKQSHKWTKYKALTVLGFSYMPINAPAEGMFRHRGMRMHVTMEERASSFYGADHERRPALFSETNADSTAVMKAFLHLPRKKIFIGAIAASYRPLPGTPEMIETFRKAGTRFVLFSRHNETTTTAFGEQLGLETSFNCCISLKDEESISRASTPGQRGEEIVKLPRGISNVRRHIEEVDNVPLLVEMFANSTPEAASEMISIQQLHGEIVACVSSSLSTWNMSCLAQADAAISLMPVFPHEKLPVVRLRKGSDLEDVLERRESDLEDRDINENIDSDPILWLNRMFTSLTLNATFPPSMLPAVFLTARRFWRNYKQALLFYLAMQTLLLFINVLGRILMWPIILPGLHIIWICCVEMPILSIGLLFTLEDSTGATEMPQKKRQSFESLGRFVGYAVLRFLPTAFIIVGIFIFTTLAMAPTANAEDLFLASSLLRVSELDRTEQLPASLAKGVLQAQDFTIFFIVYYMGAHALSFFRRTATLRRTPPHRNPAWIKSVVLALVLQIIFSIVATAVSERTFGTGMLPPLPPWAFVVMICWPAAIVGIDELVKSCDRKKYRHAQKFWRLEFNTRLGRYSP